MILMVVVVGDVLGFGWVDGHHAHRDRTRRVGRAAPVWLAVASCRGADVTVWVGGKAVLAVIRAEPVLLPVDGRGDRCVFDLDLHPADRFLGVAAAADVAVAVEPVETANAPRARMLSTLVWCQAKPVCTTSRDRFGSERSTAVNRYSTARPAMLIVAQNVARIRRLIAVPKYLR